jgi:hypothetical protein
MYDPVTHDSSTVSSINRFFLGREKKEVQKKETKGRGKKKE